mmetsp:Transcript_97567/g.271437  ORF Transcript_97567/g.271437 Transcript_97567/m.271437 type:complete len:221 (-) Transcript_97567:112-774(-)
MLLANRKPTCWCWSALSRVSQQAPPLSSRWHTSLRQVGPGGRPCQEQSALVVEARGAPRTAHPAATGNWSLQVCAGAAAAAAVGESSPSAPPGVPGPPLPAITTDAASVSTEAPPGAAPSASVAACASRAARRAGSEKRSGSAAAEAATTATTTATLLTSARAGTDHVGAALAADVPDTAAAAIECRPSSATEHTLLLLRHSSQKVPSCAAPHQWPGLPP